MSFINLDEARKRLFMNGHKFQRNISEEKANKMIEENRNKPISWYYRCAIRDCSGSVTIIDENIKRTSPHSTHYKLSDCELEIILKTHAIKKN